jgi:hypothetical protein
MFIINQLETTEVFSKTSSSDNIDTVINRPKINQDKLKNFIIATQGGYDTSLPYHNDLHGIDVCQTLFSWFSFTGIAKAFELGFFDILSIYTAGLVHDFRHPGVNNMYLLNSKSELAIIYNDKSILENFHVSETFKVILRNETNIFSEFSVEEQRICRFILSLFQF